MAQCPTPVGQIVIDGNPCDWSGLAGQPIKAYVPDAFGNTVDNQFTLGSKDFNLASDLRWSLGQTKDKGDIANAAAALIDGFLYFAGDRTSNNGAAQIGFWFYLNGTGPNTRPDGTKDFAPPHTVGDLLILADFTNGGTNAIVTSYQWVGTGGNVPNTNGTLNTFSINAVVAINNAAGFNVPATWLFPRPMYEINEFYEGRIDLEGLTLPSICFSSFLLETRSSPSITASLEDFVGGAFPVRPVVSIDNRAVCAGQPVTFTATATGGIPPLT